jgi:hypothetical protein
MPPSFAPVRLRAPSPGLRIEAYAREMLDLVEQLRRLFLGF